MNNNYQILSELQFQEIGEWKVSSDGNSIEYAINSKSYLDIPNVLYSFVVDSDTTSFDGYIGKTSKTIKNRFQGYVKPGADQKTNIRVSEKIVQCLKKGQKVYIYALFDIEPLQWGSYSINLAAGLEDSMVQKLKPTWNIAGVKGGKLITSTEEFEDEFVSTTVSATNEYESALVSFKIVLGKAYYYKGYMNPGVKASEYLGEEGESVTLVLPNGKTLESIIDRSANPNKSVRIYFGQDLAMWYQSNCEFNDELVGLVKSGNKIFIEKP